MSSVFDSDKTVTNCFDGVLTATGDNVCKTLDSAKSWAQVVLNKREYPSYPDRSSANYVHYVNITNSAVNPENLGHFELNYQGDDDVWRSCPKGTCIDTPGWSGQWEEAGVELV